MRESAPEPSPSLPPTSKIAVEEFIAVLKNNGPEVWSLHCDAMKWRTSSDSLEDAIRILQEGLAEELKIPVESVHIKVVESPSAS